MNFVVLLKSAGLQIRGYIGKLFSSLLIQSIFLRHDSHNKVKHSWKFPVPLLGMKPGSSLYKTNALTTEPKSRLSGAVVRDWFYTRSYAKTTLCSYIGESAWPVTLPFFKEVTIYDDGKPF